MALLFMYYLFRYVGGFGFGDLGIGTVVGNAFKTLAVGRNNQNEKHNDLNSDQNHTLLIIRLLEGYVKNKANCQSEKYKSEQPNRNVCGDEGCKHK